MLPEEIANMSMDHQGTCYQNINLQPASAEEQQSIEAAKSLLINSNGDYVRGDLAIFGYCVIADNDTRAANAFIKEQNRIIGAAADGLADHLPDKGNVMKCSNNALYMLAKYHLLLRGVHALCPKQINMLNIRNNTMSLTTLVLCFFYLSNMLLGS